MKQNILKFLLFALSITMLTRYAIGGGHSEWESGLQGPETFWGGETNGVKSALHIETLPSTNTLIKCTPILKNSRTNSLLLYFPPLKNRYIMELKDSNGRPVEKTGMGKALNEALTEPFGLTTGINQSAGYRRLPPMDPNYSSRLDGYEFNLQDYFVITNSGKYSLTFQMRVIWFPPNWKGSRKSINVPIVNLPPVNTQIEIK